MNNECIFCLCIFVYLTCVGVVYMIVHLCMNLSQPLLSVSRYIVSTYTLTGTASTNKAENGQRRAQIVV